MSVNFCELTFHRTSQSGNIQTLNSYLTVNTQLLPYKYQSPMYKVHGSNLFLIIRNAAIHSMQKNSEILSGIESCKSS
jgi:hypothetical protein